MSTKFKSGVSGVEILRFFGGTEKGALLKVSRRNTQAEFSVEEARGRFNTDSINMTLLEARQIGETLIALSSEETTSKVERDNQ